ncbi:tail fiber protein [Fluviicola taffensis]|uniref:phage tail protein n=1 Tax=Fluviicola taffensis TaxID=191579 RepID=UPI003137A81C
MSEIRFFAGNFSPKYWAYCQGQLLSIAQNTALFSLLGTVYGGNGTTTFSLPNLASRTPVGTGTGPGLGTIDLGEMAGAPTTTLIQTQMPAHSHPGSSTISVPAYSEAGTSADPSGALLASMNGLYKTGTPADSFLAPMGGSVVVGSAGGSQPLNIEQPYLAMNIIICLQGIYPSRN